MMEEWKVAEYDDYDYRDYIYGDDGDRAYDAWKDGETTRYGETYLEYRKRTKAKMKTKKETNE